MVKEIEVEIDFIISAVLTFTGIILYGYSPIFSSSNGQLITNQIEISGIVIAIVGLFFFCLVVFILTTKTLD